MQTLEFDRLTGKTANDRNRKFNKIALIIYFGAGLVVQGLFLVDAIAGWTVRRGGTYQQTIALSQLGFIVLLLELYGCFEEKSQNEEKAAQIDRFLKIFKNEILTKYKPTDIKNASMMGELVLGYMSNEEKEKVKNLYAETDFSDYASVKNFIEKIEQIANPIFARNQGLDKQLEDIATGQTYMFNGWQYGNQGHGSR